jgi:hypothetical protein
MLVPYQGRHHLTSSRLRNYTSATSVIQKYHVWALREDPSYLANTIKEYEDHLVPRNLRSMKSTTELGRLNEYRVHIIRTIVDESYSMLVGWHQLDADLAGEHPVRTQVDEFYGNYIHGWENHPAPVEHVYPYQEKLRYPAHKRRTRDNVQAMREAEANLHVFWGKIDATSVNLIGVGPPRIIQACLDEGGEMR